MEYKTFVVRAFEREPGKWRASVRRPDAKPLQSGSRKKLKTFVTAFDAETGSAALLIAITAIDAGSFWRQKVRVVEKFWRLGSKGSNAMDLGDR